MNNRFDVDDIDIDELGLGEVNLDDLMETYGQDVAEYQSSISDIMNNIMEVGLREESDTNELVESLSDMDTFEEDNDSEDSNQEEDMEEDETTSWDVEDEEFSFLDDLLGSNEDNGNVMSIDSIQDRIITEEVNEEVNEETDTSEFERLDSLYGEEDKYKLAGDLYRDIDLTLKGIGYIYNVVGATISRNIKKLDYEVPSVNRYNKEDPRSLEMSKELYERIKYRMLESYKGDKLGYQRTFSRIFGRDMLVEEHRHRKSEEVVNYDTGNNEEGNKVLIKDLAKQMASVEEDYKKEISSDEESIVWIYKEIESVLLNYLGGLYKSGELKIGLVVSYPNGITVRYQNINRLETLGLGISKVTLEVNMGEDIRIYFGEESSNIDEKIDELVDLYNNSFGRTKKAKVTNIGLRKVVGISYE